MLTQIKQRLLIVGLAAAPAIVVLTESAGWGRW